MDLAIVGYEFMQRYMYISNGDSDLFVIMLRRKIRISSALSSFTPDRYNVGSCIYNASIFLTLLPSDSYIIESSLSVLLLLNPINCLARVEAFQFFEK